MKKIASILFLMAVCMLLSDIHPLNASASELTTEYDYATLFAESQNVYQNVDLHSAYSSTLNQVYSEDSVAFLDALCAIDTETFQRVTRFWLDGKPLEELKTLHTAITQFANSLDYSNILDVITAKIDHIEFALALDGKSSHVTSSDHSFFVPVVVHMIDLHFELGNPDEEFNQALASAYEKSPALLAETIHIYEEDEIEHLAECIADDYVKANRAAPVTTYSQESSEYGDIINLINETIASKLSTQMQNENTVAPVDPIVPMSLNVPTIDAITYTSTPLQAYYQETLKVTLSESSAVSSLRQWYVKVYQRIGTANKLKAAKTVTFSPGTTSSSVTFTVSFDFPTQFYTYVEVYSSEGGSLLTSKLSGITKVTGKWYIDVLLPEERSNPGILYLYDAFNDLRHEASCLGKSSENLSVSQVGGDTPLGVYSGILDGPDSDTEKYGPYKYVDLEGISGECMNYPYRGDFMIHGGRRQDVLVPTEGCVRVFNTTQKAIQDIVTSLINYSYHETHGYVYVQNLDAMG